MHSRSVLCLIAAIFTIATSALADEAAIKNGEAVVHAATQWLALLDEEKYEDSWAQAATAFQSSADKKTWKARIARFRSTLGPIKARSLSFMQYDQLNAATDICTLYWFSQYENRILERETLLMIYEKDSWRVAGYFGK